MRLQRGFTLMEVLMTLSLIGTAALIAERLFVASMNTMESNRQIANAQAAADHCDTLLRQDTWAATHLDVLDGTQIQFANADDVSICWTIADDMMLRSDGSNAQKWSAGGLRFAADPVGLSLVDASGKVLRTFILPAQLIGAKR